MRRRLARGTLRSPVRWRMCCGLPSARSWLLPFLGRIVGMVLFLFGENVAQAVEAALPERAALGDPLLRQFQPPGLDATGAHPPDLFRSDDAALFEHLEVLNDRGQGDVKRLCQFAHRTRSGG